VSYVDKEKERATKRKYYQKHKERERARGREKKRKARARRGDEINAKNRERYAKNRVTEATKQNERRRRRLPYIGLRTAIRDCETGALDFNELIERLSRSLALSNEIMRTRRGLRSDDRRVHGSQHERNGQEHSRSNSSKDSSG